MKYRAEIDGLRALAVVPVILFHAGFEWFGGGFVGVDVFFVISGYLIGNIVFVEMMDGKFSLVNFYERRARRILPALFLVMSVCVPFGWMWLNPTDLKDFGQSLLAVVTFSSNILFWWESGYFGAAQELRPLLHTWSLAVEEQYYIFFPLFLILTWRLGTKWIVGLLSLIFMLSLGISEWGASHKPMAAFYFLPGRVWELLMGFFVAIYLQYKPRPKANSISQIFGIFGLGMILYSIVFFDEHTLFPGFHALVPTIGTGLIILFAVPKTLIHRVLSIKLAVGIGLISYGAYLWHQPLLAFARHRFLGEVSASLLISLCVASFLIAWLTWYFVEKPFRDRKIISRRFVFVFSSLGIFVFSSLGILLHLEEGYKHRAGFSDDLSNSFSRPSLGECFDTPFNHLSKSWGCYLGEKKPKVDFVLFGDSHSLSLRMLVNDMASKRGISVFFTGSSGCVPFIGVYPDREDIYENNCYLLNQRVYEFANKNEVKGIILSARWSYYTLGDYSLGGGQLISDKPYGPFSLEHSIDTFSKAFNITVDKYALSDIPIHLITQNPHQKYSPESAYFSVSKGYGSLDSLSIERSQFENLNAIPLAVFKERRDEIDLAIITDVFCGDEICPIGDQYKSYYYDDDHLSSYGALKLTGIIERFFERSGDNR